MRLITKFLTIVFLIGVIVAVYQYVPLIFSPTLEETELVSFAEGMIYYKYGIDANVSSITLLASKVIEVKVPVVYSRESKVCYPAVEGSELFDKAGSKVESEFSGGKICWSIGEREVVLKSSTRVPVKDFATSYATENELKIKIMNVKAYPLILDIVVDIEDKFGNSTFSVYKNQLYLASTKKTFSDNFIVAPYSQTEYSFKVA